MSLDKKVNELEIRIRPNSDEALLDQHNKSKNESENLYNYIIEGIMLRSKVNWYEYRKFHLRKVVKTNEQETSDPIEIVRSLKNVYSSLYRKRSNKTEDECIAYLRNINTPKLTDDERNACEGTN